MKRLIKKVLENIILAYMLLIFWPYILGLGMYFALKAIAKEGSSLDAKLGGLETQILDLIVQLVGDTDITFIMMNITALISLLLMFFFLRRYKFVVPRKDHKEESK